MRQIEHQKQVTGNGCMSACLAMVAGKPVEEITRKYHSRIFHERSMTLGEALKELGVIASPGPNIDGQHRIEPHYVYLLAVPSLNIPGMFHEIVFDWRELFNPKIYDPSKGYLDRKYYTTDEDEVDCCKRAVKLTSWFVDYRLVID